MKSLLHQRQRFGNLIVMPKSAILIFKNYQVAGPIQARLPARVVKKHER